MAGPLGAVGGAGIVYLMKEYGDEIKRTGDKSLPFTDYLFKRVGLEPGLLDEGEMGRLKERITELPEDIQNFITGLASAEEQAFAEEFEK